MKQAAADHNQTIPQSFTHQFVDCLSLRNCREQQEHTLSKIVANGMGFSSQTHSNMKRSNNPQLHANDSMPSVSVFLPDHALFSVTQTKSCKQNIVSKSEHVREAEGCLRSPPPSGTADHPRYQEGQLDLNQSMASESNPWSESCLGDFISACTQSTSMYPRTISTTPARIPLPIQFTGTFPVYVNAKQYSAIIRRRKIRSKLEAQNKLSKSKKPYLHESRHRHAVRRARGSGGRFLNSKTIESTKPISHNHGKCQSHQNSQSGSWESSPRNSDMTNMFNGDGIFPHQELNDWNPSLQIGFSTMVVARRPHR